MTDWRKRRIRERMGDPRREGLPPKSERLMPLVRAAREDRELKGFFLQVGALKERDRVNFLNRKVEEARKRGAPEEFCRGLAALGDAATFERLLKLL